MSLFNKKIYIVIYLITNFLLYTEVLAAESNFKYNKNDISNYFSGMISADQDYNDITFNYLKKVKSLKKKHSEFNIEFIRTLVLLEKFEEAFEFSNSVWNKSDIFYETDLLLGLESFLKKDYKKAEQYFVRLNEVSQYNLFFEDFVGNVLIAWSKASQGKKEESFKFIEKIPKPYLKLKKTQNIFLKCYFDEKDTQESFNNLINEKSFNFSRYNFFLTNYLIHKKQIKEARKVIENAQKDQNLNILIKQTKNFLINNDTKKIKKFFNCKNPKDSLAEFFYVIANLHSSEREYKLSNFYLKISLFLNNKFLPNKTLLAENLFYQGKKDISKNVYDSIKSIGSVYTWYAAKKNSSILSSTKGPKYSMNLLKNTYDSLLNKNYEHHYELANYYKDNNFHKEAIKYYALSLNNLQTGHYLIPKILHRRGTSFEILGEWDKAEKDLTESLKILPDQAHVLNYLAYSWIDKGINLEKGLKMLLKANALKENDGYITDSLGWAYYSIKNYTNAEFFLKRAVELLPFDPIINDHYGDVLWMLNRNIQARHVWQNILNLSNAKQETKDAISKKLIFGITEKL